MLAKLIIFGPIIVLTSVVLFRTLFVFKSGPPPKACEHLPNHQKIKWDRNILDRFMEALSIPTISYKHGDYDSDAMIRLAKLIHKNYPKIHNTEFCQREFISNYTLLYTIKGTNQKLRPYLLTSHLDVVPAVRESWSSDPFKPTLKSDNYLYARGTIDAKHLLVAILESLEHMLNKGFRPQRTFYLVFGHDEEVGGLEGAKTIAEILKKRLIEGKWDELEYVLDEGNIISTTKFPGLNSNVAFIGVAEKGYLSVKLSTVGAVGHGSMPPTQTAITKLSGALSKFHSHLMPSFMGQGSEREMIEVFAAYASWPYKLVYSNFWLFKPILEYVFEKDPTLNSMIRTSTAVTLIKGGTKENVLPDSAEATVNHRIHPSQSISEIMEFDRKVINDPTIQLEVGEVRKEPSPVAPYCDDCYGYQLVKQSLLQVYPGTVVVPSVFLASSDSSWYTNISRSIYKFSAIAVELEEMKRFHGHDERISVENFGNLINFYHHLILNSDAVKLQFRPKQNDEL